MKAYRVVLEVPHTFTQQYEVAAWWTTVECPPQGVLGRRSWWSGDWRWSFRFTGTVVDEYTPTLFGGYPVGGGGGPDPRGKVQTYGLGWSEYELEKRIMKGQERAEHWSIPGLWFEVYEAGEDQVRGRAA